MTWTMPPEWTLHKRTWMGWPCNPYDEDVARLHLDRSITIVERELGDSWMRDCGSTFVVSGEGTLGAVNWTFNGWGGHTFPKGSADAHVARFVAKKAGATRLGKNLGVYRKSHIPRGSGYQEKYYFSPGDTGSKVWDTCFGRMGVGICWDQWFPETAQSMAVMGAEMLFFPTAIGSELLDSSWDSSAHWQRVQQGHAGANLMPLVASNRIGTEPGRNGTEMTFYGSSFIADITGEKVAEANRTEETVLTRTFDLDDLAEKRAYWGIFRDRRPEFYDPVISLDGRSSIFGRSQ